MPSSSQASHRGIGHLVFRVHVPKRKKHRRAGAHFISPSTKGMQIAIAGPTNVTRVLGLTVSSPGCTASSNGTICTMAFTLAPCPTTSNCYSGSISTYDGISCTSSCTIPGNADELSTNQNLTFSIAAGTSKAAGVTLDGIPTAVILVPAVGSAVTGSGSAFAVSKCVKTAQAVSIDGADADGNLIVGPGAPVTPTLSSDDTTHLAVATPAPNASPNAFTLVPPASLASATIPNANTVVHLTAGVTPLAGTGSTTPVSSQIDVTFNSDICGVVTEFRQGITGSVDGIASGPDGNLWFAPINGSVGVGKITTGGVVTEYRAGITYAPAYVAAGPDGNMWFTEPDGRVGKITTAGGVTEYTSGITSSSVPWIIAAGPDGNMWFTEAEGNRVAKIDTSGTVTEYSSGISSHSQPNGIAAGPDGNLWFTECAGNRIAKITTGGAVTEYSSGITAEAGPGFIAVGPDGNLWFSEINTTAIGKITTSAVVTEYAAGITGNSGPYGITLGPDGNMWFTEFLGDRIGKITTSGTITEYSTGITSGARPANITTGPDGNLWFSECGASVFGVGRMQ